MARKICEVKFMIMTYFHVKPDAYTFGATALVDAETLQTMKRDSRVIVKYEELEIPMYLDQDSIKINVTGNIFVELIGSNKYSKEKKEEIYDLYNTIRYRRYS